jgi:hypothetical protein
MTCQKGMAREKGGVVAAMFSPALQTEYCYAFERTIARVCLWCEAKLAPVDEPQGQWPDPGSTGPREYQFLPLN